MWIYLNAYEIGWVLSVVESWIEGEESNSYLDLKSIICNESVDRLSSSSQLVVLRQLQSGQSVACSSRPFEL